MKGAFLLAGAILFLPYGALAAQPDPPPLQCLDSQGRPSPDAAPPLRLSDPGVKRPELIHRADPVLREALRVQGLILIESIIDRSGRVCAARLRRGSGPVAEAFLQSLRQWKFKPAMRNGKAVAVFYDVTVNV